MSIEDKVTLRLVMRMMYRRESLELSETKINVQRGIAYIGGVIRPMLGVNVVLREEMRVVVDELRKVPGVHDVVMEAKLETSAKK